MVTRQMHNLQNVFPDLLIDVHRANDLLTLDDVITFYDGLKAIDRMTQLQQFQHFVAKHYFAWKSPLGLD